MFFKNIVCPVCGAACDDIQVEIKDEKIEAKNVCKMGISRFKEITSPQRLKQPLLKFGGNQDQFPGMEPLK